MNLVKFILIPILLCQKLFAAEINIGVADIAPFGYDNNKGEQVDWWQEIARRANLTINIKHSPLARLRKELESGRLDLAIYGPSPTAQQDIFDIGEHQKVHFVIFNRIHPGASTELLEGLTVGHMIGASGIEALRAAVTFTNYPVTSYQNAIKMLLNDRLDAIYTIEGFFRYEYQPYASKPLPPPYYVQSFSNKIRASKNFYQRNPELIDTIKKLSQELIDEGFIEDTQLRHRGG